AEARAARDAVPFRGEGCRTGHDDEADRLLPGVSTPPERPGASARTFGHNAGMERTNIPILDLEDFAIEIAQTAGNIAKAHFRKAFSIENKGADAFDPVTSADKAIERVLRAAIAERYPDHGIVGEEEADRDSRSPYRWSIDPIDGTRAFMMVSTL